MVRDTYGVSSSRETFALSNDFGSARAEDGKRLRELKGATGSGNPDVRKSRSDFRANQKSSISDDEVRTAGSGATEDRGSKGALRLSSLSGTGGPARSKRASGSFEDHERRAASFGRQRVPGREVLRTSCSRRFAPATARDQSVPRAVRAGHARRYAPRVRGGFAASRGPQAEPEPPGERSSPELAGASRPRTVGAFEPIVVAVAAPIATAYLNTTGDRAGTVIRNGRVAPPMSHGLWRWRALPPADSPARSPTVA